MNRLLNSFSNAINGIITYFKTGGNVIIHLVSGLIAILLAYLLDCTRIEWIIIILIIGIVLAAEALNTAIEYIVDIVSPEYNQKAGEIKDMAAGAVLLISISAIVAGTIIFLPKMIHFF